MFGTLEVLNHSFETFLDQGDPRVKNWPFMRTPFPGIAMITAYVYFVKVAGPHFMSKRKAYDLRTPMIVYNFSMVFVNLVAFLGIGRYGYFSDYTLKCQPVDYSNRLEAVRMAQIGYLFYLTKFIEFADTIFFVLRKKENQISALHVIHHSIVPFSLWFGIKFAPGGYNAFFPFLNSFVHVIMYTYYGVAAMGEKYKKYLGWKKYMTYLQLLQFVGVIVYAISLTINKCDISKTFIMMNFIHALLFFGLFVNFFFQNYMKTKSRPTHAVLISKEQPKLCLKFHQNAPNGSIKQTNGCIKQTNGCIEQDSGGIKQTNGCIEQNNGSIQQTNGCIKQNSGCIKQNSGCIEQINGGCLKQINGCIKQNNDCIEQVKGQTSQKNDIEEDMFEQENIFYRTHLKCS